MTKDEETFLSRVADVMVANPAITIEDAMKAVLERDEQLWLEVAQRTEIGEAIAEEMAAGIYKRLRS